MLNKLLNITQSCIMPQYNVDYSIFCWLWATFASHIGNVTFPCSVPVLWQDRMLAKLTKQILIDHWISAWPSYTWWSPLFGLTKTSSGLVPAGFVARQKPSESTLSIDVGGKTETRHGPSEHSAGSVSRQPLCTYITATPISVNRYHNHRHHHLWIYVAPITKWT